MYRRKHHTQRSGDTRHLDSIGNAMGYLSGGQHIAFGDCIKLIMGSLREEPKTGKMMDLDYLGRNKHVKIRINIVSQYVCLTMSCA